MSKRHVNPPKHKRLTGLVGYVPCACRDCFETAIGLPGCLCHGCEAACCQPGKECERPEAYGAKPCE
jgi:hypothetical protein